MGKLRPFVRKDSYMPNKKWIPFVIGNGYTTTDGASGPAPEYETVTGNPVSFNAITPFPLKQLSVAFSPVQDLHGYDSPWPAGGGANKWDEEWEVGNIDNSTGANVSDNTLIRSKNYIEVMPNTTYCATIGAAGGGVNIHMFFYDASKNFLSHSQIYDASNNYKTFSTDGASFVRFRLTQAYGTTYNHDIAINYPATVTTYSPYSNLCPISGWDSLNVEQAGKNLLDTSKGYTGVGYNVADGTAINLTETENYTISGNKITFTSSGWSHRDFLTPPLKDGAYHVTIDATKVTSPRITLYTIDADGKIVSHNNYTSASVISANRHPLDGYRILVSIGTNTAQELEVADVQVESGTATTAWEAPNVRSISISLGSTVYSGYVDVVTGVVTVDMASVDMGSLTWSAESDHYYSSAISTAKTPPDNTTPANAICSNYINLARNDVYFQATDMSVAISNTGRVYVYDSTLAGKTREEFKTAMNGVQLVYELATPLTIQLTPQEVQSLAGDNTMWSDANGDLTVEYRSN